MTVGRLDGPKESPESERTGKSRVDVARRELLVKPFTETLHPSPKQVVPIAGGDPQSGRKGAI